MVKMYAQYSGELHCELRHGPSNSTLETDAPKDNLGKGERFSPTDLVGAAFASCILTTMAIVAERDQINIVGAKVEIEKVMVPNPRRIGEFPIKVTLPASLQAEAKKKLENAAITCPVAKSLNPEIKVTFEFQYL